MRLIIINPSIFDPSLRWRKEVKGELSEEKREGKRSIVKNERSFLRFEEVKR